jgi:hypothetical protein
MSEPRVNEDLMREHLINAFQAGLLAVPVVGSSLERLLFGTIAEMRSKRVLRTLEEICKKLEEKEAVSQVDDNEDLANFLEKVLPQTARATNENKRKRFRDLVFKAIQVPSGDEAWSGANIAANLLEQIDDVGIELLSYFHRCEQASGGNVCAIVKRAEAIVFGLQNADDSFSYVFPFNERFPLYELTASLDVIRHALGQLQSLNVLHYEDMNKLLRNITDGDYYYILMDWAMDDSFDDNETATPSSEHRDCGCEVNGSADGLDSASIPF